MSTANRRRGVLAFGMQSAVGVIDTTPLYAVPIVSGGLKANRDRADLPVTRPTDARPGQYIQKAWGGGTITILAHPEALGLLLYSVMYAKAVTTLTGNALGTRYRHIFTMSDTQPTTPLTFWSLVGDAWERLSDSYVQKLTLRGQSGENVLVELDVVSWGAEEVLAPTYSLTADKPRLKYIGSRIYMDADGAASSATDRMTNVESVELVIDRSLELRYGPFLQPKLGIPTRNVDFSANMTYDTAQQGWDFYRVAKFADATAPAGGGTAAAPEMSQELLSGSFICQFGRHPEVLDDSVPAIPGKYLRFYSGPPPTSYPAYPSAITAPAVNWEFDVERPDADPGGGPVDVQVAGMVVDPGPDGDGNPQTELTVELVNDTASYAP